MFTYAIYNVTISVFYSGEYVRFLLRTEVELLSDEELADILHLDEATPELRTMLAVLRDELKDAGLIAW